MMWTRVFTKHRGAARAAGACAATVAVVVGLSAWSSAQGPGFNPQDLFQKLDGNGDRVIDRGEVPESAKKSFETLLAAGDANHDGRLQIDEYRALLLSLRDEFATKKAKGKAALSARFATLDKNGDGKVARDEFDGPPARFNLLDADKDGFVTLKEFRAAAAAFATKTKAAGKTKAKAKIEA